MQKEKKASQNCVKYFEDKEMREMFQWVSMSSSNWVAVPHTFAPILFSIIVIVFRIWIFRIHFIHLFRIHFIHSSNKYVFYWRSLYVWLMFWFFNYNFKWYLRNGWLIVVYKLLEFKLVFTPNPIIDIIPISARKSTMSKTFIKVILILT